MTRRRCERPCGEETTTFELPGRQQGKSEKVKVKTIGHVILFVIVGKIVFVNVEELTMVHHGDAERTER